jgi:tetratricopeptide (TPR) repeat protein
MGATQQYYQRQSQPGKKAGPVKAAVKPFEQAIRLAPDRPDIEHNVAEALRQTGEPQKAIEHYRAALRLQPGFAQAAANLAQALADAAQPEEAIAAAEQAIKIAQISRQPEVAREIQKWLTHYRDELQHGEKRADTPPLPRRDQSHAK